MLPFDPVWRWRVFVVLVAWPAIVALWVLGRAAIGAPGSDSNFRHAGRWRPDARRVARLRALLARADAKLEPGEPLGVAVGSGDQPDRIQIALWAAYLLPSRDVLSWDPRVRDARHVVCFECTLDVPQARREEVFPEGTLYSVPSPVGARPE